MGEEIVVCAALSSLAATSCIVLDPFGSLTLDLAFAAPLGVAIVLVAGRARLQGLRHSVAVSLLGLAIGWIPILAAVVATR